MRLVWLFKFVISLESRPHQHKLALNLGSRKCGGSATVAAAARVSQTPHASRRQQAWKEGRKEGRKEGSGSSDQAVTSHRRPSPLLQYRSPCKQSFHFTTILHTPPTWASPPTANRSHRRTCLLSLSLDSWSSVSSYHTYRSTPRSSAGGRAKDSRHGGCCWAA